jgi:hypothetical protein
MEDDELYKNANLDWVKYPRVALPQSMELFKVLESAENAKGVTFISALEDAYNTPPEKLPSLVKLGLQIFLHDPRFFKPAVAEELRGLSQGLVEGLRLQEEVVINQDDWEVKGGGEDQMMQNSGD